MWKKIGIAALALLVIALTLKGPAGDRLVLAYMQKQVIKNLSGERFAEFPDGLNIVLCGAGSPIPDSTRAGPCVAVIAGQQIVVVDTGSGAVRNLPLSGIPVGKVAAVFLTHFHSDHIDGLGDLMMQRWGNGANTAPLPVYGPPGVEQVVAGFNMAYGLDDSYRIAHHGPAIIPPSGAGGIARTFATPKLGEGLVIYEQDGLKVTSFVVDHGPVAPAVGYRFDYQGRSAVLSGDTRKSANLAQFTKGADLLVHEAISPELVGVLTAGAKAAGATNIEQITRDILNYHTTPVEVAEIAQAAGVRQVLYYHLVPALPLHRLDSIFLRGVSDVYQGGVLVGQDRSWVALPAHSDKVVVGRRRAP